MAEEPKALETQQKPPGGARPPGGTGGGAVDRNDSGPPEDIGGKALSDALRVSFTFLKVGMVILIGVYVAMGVFYVNPDEVCVKLSFGRPVKMGKRYVMDAESGWHIRWPWQDVISIPLKEQTLDLKKDFWFKGTGAPEESAPPPSGPEAPGLTVKDDGYLITGDINVVHMRLRARYRALVDTDEHALDYAFRIKEPQELLKRFVVAGTIETVASWPVMEALGSHMLVLPADERGPEREVYLDKEIERRAQAKLDEFNKAAGRTAGIELISVELVEGPVMPRDVRRAYDEAKKAETERAKAVDEARSEATRAVSDAKSRASQIITEADGYKKRLQAVAKADAETLEKLRLAYMASPEMARILRERHYERVMEDLLGQAEGSFVLHRPAAGGKRQIRLLLSPERKQTPKAEGIGGPGQPQRKD